jgi:FkbM family methyltransferase
MKIDLKLIYKLYHAYKRNFVEFSFSQYGEDVIIRQIFNSLKILNPSYLDIGAHDPIQLSNTYNFYLKNSKGFLIEPNPILIPKLRKIRKWDTILNIGIGNGNQNSADLFILNNDVLSTFSEEEAKLYEKLGHKIKSKVKVPLISINDVIENKIGYCPDFVSIDIEGKEYEILETFDFSKFRPKIFCIETWSYAKTQKENNIIELMHKNNYLTVADTTLNTIFKDRMLNNKTE